MHTSVLVGLIALFNRAVHATVYTLDTTYNSSNFFTSFGFFNEEDPTNGFVEYVDADTANTDGLAGYRDGAVYLGVDTTTVNPASGRKSVRVTSRQAFTYGLFITDIAHMPGSICGVWPAMWFFGPNWPASGEIDIIEGVNTQTYNTITLHTSSGCSISNRGTIESTTLTETDCNAGEASTGCSQITTDNQNYGNGFNNNGGGVYAMEWTSDYISVWFFPRNYIPASVQGDNPDPSTWGLPIARFVGGSSCNMDAHFQNNHLVFDTTFCGDWAGSTDVWNNNAECLAMGSTCNEFVAANPAAFSEAYWLIESIKVFKLTASNYTAKRSLLYSPFLT
ncbi:concanavalin A-like lectin/glucanase domain-containing protein [Ilyonectria robusta]|uniref:concanavalin A-like lectin/glucanase domain-containing protein n=1 Tax=Ilyonectria robusta TaxID=1079257 RepID=UPI001E8ED023|nr:concanavalin A-like lectin/glucanase domain-containing protein [Ilyonectria robusta]KAH8659418.1 concanavalin A-like lectin/glucanase domain-containing protein [Ilyonectria robusta]